MPTRKYIIISLIAIPIVLFSFTKNSESVNVSHYYDNQLDNLLTSAHTLQQRICTKAAKDTIVKYFLQCRSNYKKIEFFIDIFDVSKSRQLNGPDLLKIDSDAPKDSMKPHGLQTMEAILYSSNADRKKLQEECSAFTQMLKAMRNDPDRVYYFSDARIWEALRLGTFRIIALGITGFDVPVSFHAIPETRCVLSSMWQVIRIYKARIPRDELSKGAILFAGADRYLQIHTDFNRFNRLEFIREHVNKISAWISTQSKKLNDINHTQLTPLHPDAEHLFAADIMNLAFFSPNPDNLLTNERAALGKRLFYDTRISGNNSRSCASCHQPGKAFTDGLQVPTDLTGNKRLARNTPTLYNAVFQANQFYDSRARTLEIQLGEVVHNKDEMNGSLADQALRLKEDSEYVSLFARAYGGDNCINEFNIANAISSYVRSLNSFNSRFDRYIRHETDSFTVSERNGFNLFMGKARCGTCHYAPVFNGLIPPLYQESESEILGVPADNQQQSTIDGDEGKYGFTKVPLHKYAFKTPTLRNIALTAPYMHNGIFATLEEVINFYNDGGGAGRGIHIENQTLPTDKLHLTRREIKDITAFLNTLTDFSP